MATRRERVMLDLSTNFPEEAAKAAAAIRLLNEEINHLGGKGTNRSALKTVSRDMEDVGRRAERAAPSIDKFSGRVSILAQGLASVGSSAIPISAVAIPAITGLASSFGFAALAGGTMVGAFQGVGDALKALNDAALNPTEAHLQAAREAMASISPEAQKFVRELRTMQPELERLRDIAAQGMFPGMAEGLSQLTSAMPAVERIVGAVSGELGTLSAEAGKSLGGPRWADFFDFLATEAPKALADMGHGIGNVTHALAELWMAFTPLNNSFSSWLVDSTADLDKWASGLAKTQGFQEFVGYIQQNGPQVAATMGAIANAVLQIVEAAAPIGGPVLKGLEGLANAIANIADSDIGTPLFGMVAALSALNLAMKAGQGIQNKFGAMQTRVTAGFEKQRTSLRSLAADYAAIQRNNKAPQSIFAIGGNGEAQRISAVAQETERFQKNLRATAVEAGKAGALVGAFALASTGMGDKLGVSNTIMLAMAGSVIPGYGTAIGAAVGLVLDLAHANDDLASAGKAAQAAMDSHNVDAMAAAYERLNAQIAASKDTPNGLENASKYVPVAGPYLGSLAKHMRGSEVDDQKKQLAGLRKELTANDDGADRLLHTFGLLPPAFSLTGAAAAAAAEMLRANRQAAGETAQSFVGLGKSLSNSKVSLNGWIHDMSNMAAALQRFTANSLVAANKGLRQGLIAELQKAGPEGALRMKQLADGTEKQIHRANQAWLSQRAAVKGYKDAIGGVPTSRSTKVTAPGALQAKAQIKTMRDEIDRLKDKTVHTDEKGAAAARARIAALRAAIAALRDRTVTITTFHRQTGGGPNAVADGGTILNYGGTVPGERDPYGDKVPAYLAPGEEVISNRFGQADRHRDLLKRINANMLAEGGTVLHLAGGGTARHHGGGEYESLHDRIRRLNAELDRSTRSIQRERSARDDLVSKRNDLRSTVSGNFLSDPFAGGNIWAAGGGNPTAILKADIAKANAFKSTLAQLKKQGLNGSALAAIASTGNVGQAQALLSMGKSGIGQYESAYNQRYRAAQAVGAYAGNAVYGAAITTTAHEVAKLNATVHRLEVQLKHRHQESQKNHKRNSDNVGKGINKAATAAQHHKRRHGK